MQLRNWVLSFQVSCLLVHFSNDLFTQKVKRKQQKLVVEKKKKQVNNKTSRNKSNDDNNENDDNNNESKTLTRRGRAICVTVQTNFTVLP